MTASVTWLLSQDRLSKNRTAFRMREVQSNIGESRWRLIAAGLGATPAQHPENHVGPAAAAAWHRQAAQIPGRSGAADFNLMSMPGYAGFIELVCGISAGLGLFTRPAAFSRLGHDGGRVFHGPRPARLFPDLEPGRAGGALLLRFPLPRRGRRGPVERRRDAPQVTLTTSPPHGTTRDGRAQERAVSNVAPGTRVPCKAQEELLRVLAVPIKPAPLSRAGRKIASKFHSLLAGALAAPRSCRAGWSRAARRRGQVEARQADHDLQSFRRGRRHRRACPPARRDGRQDLGPAGRRRRQAGRRRHAGAGHAAQRQA